MMISANLMSIYQFVAELSHLLGQFNSCNLAFDLENKVKVNKTKLILGTVLKVDLCKSGGNQYNYSLGNLF